MNSRYWFIVTFIISCAATPALAEPNTAQVCAETSKVLAQIEGEYQEAELLNWVREGDYYESDEYSDELKEAIRTGRVSLKLDYMAARLYSEVPARNADRLAFQPVLLAKIKRLVSKARAFTGEQEQTGIPLLNPEDDEDQPRSPELIAKINELELNALRLQQQMNLRKQRLSDLNCANLPVASTAPGGALALTKTVLIRDHGNGDCTYTCLDYRYGEDWASFLIVGDAPDRRKITWNWAGMPGSLDSGQEFTITITGTLDFKPAGAEKGANVAAGLRQIGLISLKEQNAYFYQGASSPGSYTYKVPAGAKRVEFALSADNNIGTFIRYCYGDCPQ